MESNLTNSLSSKRETIFGDKPEEVNSGDATWILTSAFIIFTMQSGFGLLESGIVSRKNEVNIMVKNAVDVIFGGLAYWMFGFALSFGDEPGTNAFSGMGMFLTEAADDERMGSIYSRYFFQLSFATTATTIVSGAMAERTNLKAYTAFSFLNTLTYCFPAHWVWADNGWLKNMGAIDIAGSSAVHVVGGVSGLVATMFLKPRTSFKGVSDDNNTDSSMASPTNVLLGTFMLWWGWLGFNCGSTFGISGEKWKLAARSAVCTINASIGGGIAGMFYSYVFYKNKLKIQIFVTGLLGGLVGITASCAVTRPSYAIIIGIIGGTLACASCKILLRLNIDDPVGCVPVHLVSGVWSLVAVAFFVEEDKSGGFSSQGGIFHGGRWELLGAQVALAVSSGLWSACVTLILLTSINTIFPIRLSLEDELKGCDICEHGISLPSALNQIGERSSAYGTRTTSPTYCRDNQNDSNPSGSNPSASNQSIEQDSAVSSMVNENENENGKDFITRSRLSTSDELKMSIAVGRQTTGQLNVGFSTDF